MDTGHPLSLLIYMTFAAAAAVAIILLVRFMRKPANRHPMQGERERDIGEITGEGGSGTENRP